MGHGVLGDGEHHHATAIPWNFCCRDDRACGLRLHSDPETQKDSRRLKRLAFDYGLVKSHRCLRAAPLVAANIAKLPEKLSDAKAQS